MAQSCWTEVCTARHPTLSGQTGPSVPAAPSLSVTLGPWSGGAGLPGALGDLLSAFWRLTWVWK